MRAILLSLLLFLPFAASCDAFSEADRSTIMQVADEMKTNGTLTQAQYDAVIEAMNQASGIDWEEFLLGLAGAVVATFTGIRITRGAPKPLTRVEAQEFVATVKSKTPEPTA